MYVRDINKIIFRLSNDSLLTNRLLGTHVYLYDADATKQIADCGKITEVNTEEGEDIDSQTYNLPCDTSQLTSYVKLEDSENISQDKDVIMNIGEVMVYGTLSLITGKLQTNKQQHYTIRQRL